MTQEEKQILLQDLCSRLPYKTKVNVDDSGLFIPRLKYIDGITCHFYECAWTKFIDEIKPYLRQMSSMTEDERNEYFDFRNQELQRVALAEVGRESAIAEISDWLNKKMFDYRGLIPKGLATEASEGMYKI